MLAQVIGSIVIIGFFFILNKVGVGMLGKEHPLAKVFQIGSIVLSGFFLLLIFGT